MKFTNLLLSSWLDYAEASRPWAAGCGPSFVYFFSLSLLKEKKNSRFTLAIFQLILLLPKNLHYAEPGSYGHQPTRSNRNQFGVSLSTQPTITNVALPCCWDFPIFDFRKETKFHQQQRRNIRTSASREIVGEKVQSDHHLAPSKPPKVCHVFIVRINIYDYYLDMFPPPSS